MKRPLFAILVSTTLVAAGCGRATADKTSRSAAVGSNHSDDQRRNLANFDDLDFRVYSGQKWDELGKSHAKDILVHYPDGSTTRGLAAHIERLKPQFVYAPDTKIRVHPIKLADGNYTAVEGVLEGTFTRPMDFGNGKVVQPTGKPFKLAMVTIGRWENGLMEEEWLFWDSASLMQQIGAS